MIGIAVALMLVVLLGGAARVLGVIPVLEAAASRPEAGRGTGACSWPPRCRGPPPARL